MNRDCCLSCNRLFVRSRRTPGDITLCPVCPLPVQLLSPQGEALKANPAFIARYHMDPAEKPPGARYNIFADPFLKPAVYQNKMHHAVKGRKITLHLPAYEFSWAGYQETPPPAEHLSLIIKPLMRGNTLTALVLIYYSENESPELPTEELPLDLAAVFVRSAADLKHDVNNPLLLITGNAQLMLAHPEELNPGMKRKLEKILEGVEKISTVLEQFIVTTNARCLRCEHPSAKN